MKYENKYMQERYDAMKDLVKELNTIMGANSFQLIEDNTNDGREKITTVSGAPIGIRYIDYIKKYTVYLDYKLPFTDHYTYTKLAKDMKKPNEMGVLSKPKIQAWIDYLTAINTELEKISKEREVKVNTFLARMKAEGVDISKNYDGQERTGRIVKNGLEYTFEIGETGYISENIKVYYSADKNYDSFLKLSDNKF